MIFIITIVDANGPRKPYHAIGSLAALMDAAFDSGALGVTMVPA